VLLRHLIAEGDGMVRYKILRGLGRIATEHREVPLDEKALRVATQRTLEAAFRVAHWRAVLLAGVLEDPRRRTPGHELLVAMLRDKETQTLERVFRLLGLQHRDEDFESIYRGLHNRNAKVQAGSREFLDNLLRPPLREAVLTLVGDGQEAVRAGGGPYYPAPNLRYVDVLSAMLDRGDESLRCIVAHHVGELGLTELRPRLEQLMAGGPGFFVMRVVSRALELLADNEGRRSAHAG
jgi:hypothetical protein